MTRNRYTESTAIKKFSMLLDDEYRTMKGRATACSQRMCSLLERTRRPKQNSQSGLVNVQVDVIATFSFRKIGRKCRQVFHCKNRTILEGGCHTLARIDGKESKEAFGRFISAKRHTSPFLYVMNQ